VFVILAIGGFFTSLVTFILMQFAFRAAADSHPALLFEILGFAVFIVWLAAVVGLIVGVIGLFVRLLS
jgi:hypothetical protein